MPPRIMKDDLGSEKHEHLIPESMEIEQDIFCKVCKYSFYLGCGISKIVAQLICTHSQAASSLFEAMTLFLCTLLFVNLILDLFFKVPDPRKISDTI